MGATDQRALAYLINLVDESRLILRCQSLNISQQISAVEQKRRPLLRLLRCEVAIRKLPKRRFPAGRILKCSGGFTSPGHRERSPVMVVWGEGVDLQVEHDGAGPSPRGCPACKA